MLRHLTEWLKDVAGMWMVIGILTISFLVFSAARQFGFTANQKISSVNQELNDLSFEKYNGINLTGSEVINAIKRYQEKLPVTVYTGESVDTYRGEFKPAANTRKSEKYIKPSQVYIGSLLKDADKQIIGLVFAKEGILLTDTSYKELLSKLVGANPEESTMDSLMERLTILMGNKDATILALTNQITSLTSNVGNLQSQNNTLSRQVSQLNSQVTSSKANYTSLSGEVASGKAMIASSITQKGVKTASTDSFSTLASNIRKITSDGLSYEEYTYDNSWLSGEGIQLTIAAQSVTPEYVVIYSKMHISTSYGNSNIGYYTFTSTKYSDGHYTSTITPTSGTSIVFSNNQISINIKGYMIYAGNYYLDHPGTTKVTIYGTKK
ncbi:MAG: hypothetical protein ACERKN_03310 [Velocimicrobium sp.]